MNDFRGQLGKRLDMILRVNHPDSTQVRRGRLLNILLLGVGGVDAVALISAALFTLTGGPGTDLTGVLVVSVIALGFVAGLYRLNRSSPRLAAILFLIGLTVLITFSDQPEYLIAGRSTVMFVVPIVMASVVLSPISSFILWAVVSAELVVLAAASNVDPSPLLFTALGFFLVALVGWLASRSLENALTELHQINQELDRRVAERTQDLADALVKVQSESGKNQAILESIADGVIVFDQTGQATVANPAVANLLQLPPSRIVGHNIQTLMVDAVNDADRSQLIDELNDRTHGHPNVRLQWATKTLSASVAPIHIGEDAGSGTVIVFRDITREAELDRMKSLFVSMVSHELRTPLNAILGYGEMLHEFVGGPLSEKQLGIVDRLIANTKRLLGLVNDLLDRAQLEAGKLSLRAVAFSPAVLLNDMLSVVTYMAKAKELELTTQIGEDVPGSLIGDPQRLLQVLINLVSNAIKFTAQGRVSVLIGRCDATHWLMEVSDTGSGIPLDEQPHVFDWFRQVDRSTTGRQAGVGLGLSIVKDLITLMDGEIHLTSQVGQGSTFTVILPLAHAQEKTS